MSDASDGPNGFFRGWVVPILVAILIVAFGFTVHFWREGRGLHQISREAMTIEQRDDGDIIIRFTPTDEMGDDLTPEKLDGVEVTFRIAG